MAFILGNALHGAEAGITGIWRALGKKASNFGGGIKNPTSRQAVLRGALALYGSDQKKSAKSLAALLVSQDIFDKALCEVMATHFHFSNYQLPD